MGYGGKRGARVWTMMEKEKEEEKRRRAANPSLLSLPARFCTIPSGPAAAAALCSEVAYRGSKKN